LIRVRVVGIGRLTLIVLPARLELAIQRIVVARRVELVLGLFLVGRLLHIVLFDRGRLGVAIQGVHRRLIVLKRRGLPRDIALNLALYLALYLSWRLPLDDLRVGALHPWQRT